MDKLVGQLKKRLSGRVDSEMEAKKILSHPEVQSFRKQHPHLPEKVYYRSLVQLRQLVREREHCKHCPGLEKCPNLMEGHQPHIQWYGGYIELRLAPCEKMIALEMEKKRKNLIQSHYIPEDIVNATFDQMNWDPGRVAAIEAAMDFCDQFATGSPKKGLYFYGPFGVGKSRIAGAMAQYLVQYGIDSLMVYVPDFIREIKDSIRDGMLSDKLETLKKATVLILDDIGAENITPWTRDEILGAILQYRMVYKLPTVMTSNLDLNELENHLGHSEKGGTERVKAKRIMERIRPFVDVYYVDGYNRRAN
ncbi:primosomal protein DnaI [Melghirimyces algeriensis]|nr:primosomal protein DnaI [Melghirimyces algeriensis]